MRSTLILLSLFALLLPACGETTDSDDGGSPDASSDAGGADGGSDGGTADGGDDGGTADAGADGGGSDAGGGDGGSTDAGNDGGSGTCPTASAVARVRNSGNVWETDLLSDPLATVEFDGTASADPDGDAIVTYEWTVISAPVGFVYSPTDEGPGAAVLQLSLLGHYQVQLEVVDATGARSCSPAVLNLEARTADQLAIELYWDTPLDPDQTDVGLDVGADLDLHLLRGGGTWNDRFGDGDCHLYSINPDWGEPGPNGNPSLDRDDTDGAGPEVIALRQPALTDGSDPNGYSEPYQVGIYYSDAHGFGASSAFLRIWIDGVVAFEQPALQLSASDSGPPWSGTFWKVADIHWAAGGGSVVAAPVESVGFP